MNEKRRGRSARLDKREGKYSDLLFRIFAKMHFNSSAVWHSQQQRSEKRSRKQRERPVSRCVKTQQREALSRAARAEKKKLRNVWWPSRPAAQVAAKRMWLEPLRSQRESWERSARLKTQSC